MAGRISYTGGIVRNGLVLHLDAAKRDSYPKTGTVWMDLSGGGNTGTLTNGPTFNSSNGGSIVFDGVDDYVSLSDSVSFINSTSPFTLSFWVYYLAWPYTYSDMIFLKTNTGYAFQVGASTNGTYNAIGFGSTSGWIQHHTNTGYSYFLNKWSNVTLVYNGSGATTTSNFSPYIDGVLKTLTAQGGYAATSNINRIGYNYGNGKFNGRISNLQIYNRALSTSEVLQNYNALKGRYI
jgi:hypothetical protein